MTRRIVQKWCALRDSNSRPSGSYTPADLVHLFPRPTATKEAKRMVVIHARKPLDSRAC